ncbi:uncharacterized protein LOC144108814 isoform X1 [Amblyomma americanum]
MEFPQAGNQELVRFRYVAPDRYDIENPREWATEQERELAQKLRKVLQENRIYGDEQLRHTMAVLRKLGVKDTKHFSHITAEDLLREGMPVVTARILMTKYEASGNESIWGRKLEEEVKEVLQKNNAYSDDVLGDVMAALKELRVGTTQHFKHLKAEDLESKGVPPVIARILIKEFGPTRDESRSSGKENGSFSNLGDAFQLRTPQKMKAKKRHPSLQLADDEPPNFLLYSKSCLTFTFDKNFANSSVSSPCQSVGC